MEQNIQEIPLHIYCWYCTKDLVKDQQKAARVVETICATIHRGDVQFLLCTSCRDTMVNGRAG